MSTFSLTQCAGLSVYFCIMDACQLEIHWQFVAIGDLCDLAVSSPHAAAYEPLLLSVNLDNTHGDVPQL